MHSLYKSQGESCVNIVITGASGFVGFNLSQYLAQKGHRITLLDRDDYCQRLVHISPLHERQRRTGLQHINRAWNNHAGDRGDLETNGSILSCCRDPGARTNPVQRVESGRTFRQIASGIGLVTTNHVGKGMEKTFRWYREHPEWVRQFSREYHTTRETRSFIVDMARYAVPAV